MATLPAWLLAIDPDPAAWEDRGLNRFWHTASKKQYDSGDMVKYMIREYNAKQKAEGKPPFYPGISPVPDAIKRPTTPPPPAPGTSPPPGPGTSPPPTGGPSPAPGGGGNPGAPYLPGLEPGFTWNPSGGASGNPLTGGAAFSAGPTWDAGPGGRGQAGPQRTGMAMPFKPYGDIQDFSSEILRFGGAPRSGNQGGWKGIEQPTAMRSIGGAAPPKAGVEVPGFTPINYQHPSPGGGYQNVATSPKDGTLWTDPANGQQYVWRNGAYHKIDTTSRPGPTKETPVTNLGGTGSASDPIRIDIGNNNDTTDPAILAALLRQGLA